MWAMKGVGRRGLGTNCSQAAKTFMGELSREAFGVRGACSRFRTAPCLATAPASWMHSKHFAQVGRGLAARAGGVALLALFLAGTDLAGGSGALSPQAAAPLTHEAYVWQRAWTEPVRDAITQHGSRFSGLTVLSAEVSWKGRQPQVIRVPLDYSLLTNVPCPVGLALRIGPCPAVVATNNATTAFLADVPCPVGL